jgi:hypothetical protein
MDNYTMLGYVGGNIALEFFYSGPHSLIHRIHLNNGHGVPDPSRTRDRREIHQQSDAFALRGNMSYRRFQGQLDPISSGFGGRNTAAAIKGAHRA